MPFAQYKYVLGYFPFNLSNVVYYAIRGCYIMLHPGVTCNDALKIFYGLAEVAIQAFHYILIQNIAKIKY